MKTMKNHTYEHDQARALIVWRDYVKATEPRIRWLHAVPNGGKRDPVTARKMREEGCTPGVWDYFLPVPRDCFHGMYLELKSESGKLSKDQIEFEKFAISHGYFCSVCRSWFEAKKIIEFYLSMEEK
jgi:hypothetical protein